MKVTASLAAALLSTVSFVDALPKPDKKVGLNVGAKKSGLLYFGTAIDSPGLANSTYMAIANDLKEFGQVTPANGQKWMFTEPARGVFNWTDGDAIIAPALKRGAKTRCHNLVWHSQLPEWLTSQTWDKATLISILENHIKNQVTHYKRQCYAWDVVNEAFEEDGSYRKTIFLDTIGPEYIELAFKYARKYDPTAKLYYNDYNMESINNKTKAVAELVKTFQKKRIPIDGIGMQAHFIVGSSPTYQQQVDNMRQFTKLGLEVAYTELDVRMVLPDDAAKTAQQAKDYAAAARACIDVEDCVGITVWDFYDPFSWVPYTFTGQGNADLWYGNFTKKPAYDAIIDVLLN